MVTKQLQTPTTPSTADNTLEGVFEGYPLVVAALEELLNQGFTIKKFVRLADKDKVVPVGCSLEMFEIEAAFKAFDLFRVELDFPGKPDNLVLSLIVTAINDNEDGSPELLQPYGITSECQMAMINELSRNSSPLRRLKFVDCVFLPKMPIKEIKKSTSGRLAALTYDFSIFFGEKAADLAQAIVGINDPKGTHGLKDRIKGTADTQNFATLIREHVEATLQDGQPDEA